MALLIHTSGFREEVRPASGEKFTLKELQAHVGGYIQLVKTKRGNQMLVDEDGIDKILPVNPTASVLFGARILGPALLLSPHEWD